MSMESVRTKLMATDVSVTLDTLDRTVKKVSNHVPKPFHIMLV